MSTIDTKRIGRDILYCLGTGDAAEIIRARRAAGNATQRGNDPKAGQWFPGKIVADWGSTRAEWTDRFGSSAAEGTLTTAGEVVTTYEKAQRWWSVNVQVTLDGNDTYWATSRQQFDPEKMGYWRDPESGEKLQRVNVANDTPFDEADWVSDPEGHWVFA